MDKAIARRRILDVGIVPVIRAVSAAQAMLATEAIFDSGLRIVEITLTVPGAVELITTVVRQVNSEILVGAGTVLDAGDAQRCIDSGADFLVSPGLDLPTIDIARKHQKVIIAGALTPTEVMVASKAGSDFVKIFPCGNVGGPKYIKALKGPFPNVPMIPTGGVNLQTAADFIRAGADALGVGSDLISSVALRSGNKSEISRLAREFQNAVREARHSRTPAALQ